MFPCRRTANSEFSLKSFWAPKMLAGPIFMEVGLSPLTNNTAKKTSVGEHLVKSVQPLLSSLVKKHTK